MAWPGELRNGRSLISIAGGERRPRNRWGVVGWACRVERLRGHDERGGEPLAPDVAQLIPVEQDPKVEPGGSGPDVGRVLVDPDCHQRAGLDQQPGRQSLTV